jgi:hypothetical protein
MTNDLPKVLIYVSYVSGIVPIYFLLRQRQNLKFRIAKLLGILLLVTTITDLAGFGLTKGGLPSQVTLNIYFAILFIVLSNMYALLLPEWSSGIFTICYAYCIFFLINAFYFQQVNVFQSYATAVGGAFLLIYAMLYYHALLRIMPVSNPARYLPFWINAAVIYYIGFNFILFIFSAYISFRLQQKDIVMMWAFHNANNIVKNILLTIGIGYASSYQRLGFDHDTPFRRSRIRPEEDSSELSPSRERKGEVRGVWGSK